MAISRVISVVALTVVVGTLAACMSDPSSGNVANTITPPSTFTPTVTPAVSPTPFPNPTVQTIASSPSPLPENSPTPVTILQPPQTVNGVPYEEFILLDAITRENVREIFLRGQKIGRDPHAFSKLGDSIIASAQFLRIFDGVDPFLGAYDLGEYAYLQRTIDYFHGSFARYGAAVRIGLRAQFVFDPEWTKAGMCEPAVNMVDCELWLHNPSIMLIQLGTNNRRSASLFRENYERLVRYLMYQDVVPVLITKADRSEGADNRNNRIIREIAEQYHLPLIDFDRLADTLPNRGLKADRIHLKPAPRYDYRRPETFEYGTAVHNLATLIMLDELRALFEETNKRSKE